MRKFTIFFLTYFLVVNLQLFSRTITLDELNTYPKSIAKDFYIWQFLEQNSTSKDEAEYIIEQVLRMNKNIETAFKNRGGIFKESQISLKCPVLPIEIILNDFNNSIEPDCIKQNLTPGRLIKLPKNILNNIAEKYINSNYKNIALISKVFIANELTEQILNEKPNIFLELFVNGNATIRKHQNINRELDPNFIFKFSSDEKFEKFVANVLAFDNFVKIKKSLLNVQPSIKMGTKTLSNIAFALLIENREIEAIKYFETILKSSKDQMYQDQANFWLYILTKKIDFLKQVAESWDINIYSIYAKEELKQPLNKENILNDNWDKPQNNLFTSKIDSSNPFDWISVKKEISKIAKEGGNSALIEFSNLFRSEKHIGIYTFIMDKIYNYKKHSFPTPYKNVLQDLSIEDQALIYSLARQESRFNPSSISSAYALGLMQIMPFLAKDIAKNLKQELELEDMLQPIKSLEYAKYHLKTLKKEFISPLFIAYAYNGGGGFTRKTLKSGKFSSNKDYSIFLDLETIPYAESREYGKKVIANYVIYRQLLGNPVSLHVILEDLTEPIKSDRIRKR